VNSTSKFNLIVVKTLKPVFCFSHDVPLKSKRILAKSSYILAGIEENIIENSGIFVFQNLPLLDIH
jgi:hypothetical protein